MNKKIFFILGILLIISLLVGVIAMGNIGKVKEKPINKISKNYNFYYDSNDTRFEYQGYWFSYSLNSVSIKNRFKQRWLKNRITLSKLGKRIKFNSIYPSVNLIYEANQNELKEKFIITKKKNFKKVDGNLIISGNLSFDQRLKMITNGIKYNYSDTFNTTQGINFVDSVMTRYSIPKGIAYDSIGNTTTLSYSYNNGLFSIIVPIDWLSSSLRVYPIYIDPTAIAGCFENATDIICNATSYTGNYIDTNKNITITGTTLNGQGTPGLIRLNTTQGWIKISNSIINGYGNTDGFGNAYPGSLYLYNAPLGVFIDSSTLNGYGASGSGCGSSGDKHNGKNGKCYLNLDGEINVSSSYFNCYGGGSCVGGNVNNFALGGSGYWESHSKNLNFNSGISNITSSAGGAACNPSGYTDTITTGGANSQMSFYDENVRVNGGKLNLKNKGGDSCKVRGGPCTGGTANLNIYTQGTFNFTGTINNQRGQGASCTAGTSNLYVKNSTNYLSSLGKIILRSGSLTNNINSFLNLREFTLIDFIYSGGSALNITNDIGRIGLFGSSTRPSFIVNYLKNYGILIGNTTSGLTLTGVSNQLRNDLASYYKGLTKITFLSPINNSNYTTKTVVFSINVSDKENVGIKNVSLLINGTTDQTNNSGLVGIYNFSKNFGDGTYNWSILTYDNLSDEGYIENGTFFIDVEEKPLISINSITTTAGSQTISFNSTESDNGVLDSCWYSIFNSTGQIDSATTENTTFTCNSNPQSATVSAYGDYNLTIYVNDTSNNENSTTLGFTTSNSSGTTIIVSGGGGGTTIVGTGNWTMEVSKGIKSYDKFQPAGTTLELPISFYNTGEKEQKIKLSCKDINGTFCEYVSFNNESFTLPLIKELQTTKSFKISLPQEISPQTAIFNIIGTDEEKNVNSISVKISTGNLSVIMELLTKLSLSTRSGFPYIIIFIIPLFLSLAIFGKFIPKETPLKTIWVIFFSFGISFSLIYFI